MIPVEQDIYIGTTIQTSYCNRLTYEVTRIWKDCTCPDPMDWYERREEQPTEPHYHFTMKQIHPIEPGSDIPATLGWYLFKNGVWQHLFRKDDRIIILQQQKTLQLQLF